MDPDVKLGLAIAALVLAPLFVGVLVDASRRWRR